MEDQERVIVDSRFQTYGKYYIIDLLNADRSLYDKFKIIKINNLPVFRVSITGIVVNVFEAPKLYRVKIDDSTGVVAVTIWKSAIFDNTTMNESKFDGDNTLQRCKFENENIEREILQEISNIKNKMASKELNLHFIYKPNQGDLVTVKGTINPYRDIMQINANSCTKVSCASEEYLEIIYPALLYKNMYSKPAPTVKDYEKHANSKENLIKNEKLLQDKALIQDEKFLNLVFEKLVSLKNLSAEKVNRENFANDASAICLLIKRESNNYSLINVKNAIDALKELEMKGLVYSIDDNHNYSPLQ